MFLTRDMEYKAMGLSDFSSKRVFDPVYGTTGHHRMNGILICRGPGVACPDGGRIGGGQRVEDVLEGGASIHDLAPTILYALGQPIPSEMDGRVLLDLFTPEFRAKHAVVYTESAAAGVGAVAGREGEAAYSEQEEAEMREMLEGLGYVT
jgi:hypothetical protein